MGWMQDRDLLIAETLAFVKGVKGAHAELTAPAKLVPVEENNPISHSDPVDLDPPKFERMSPLPAKNEREEIAARLASFKATQLRFQRERERYGSTTLSEAVNPGGARRPSDVRSNQPK